MNDVVITNQHTNQTIQMRMELAYDPETDQRTVQERLDTLFGMTWDWWDASTKAGNWVSSSEL